MTSHYIPDTLIYKGEEYIPYDDIALFSSYLEQHQIELSKDMLAFRGYVAKWEIRDNMLFLVELKALIPQRCDYDKTHYFKSRISSKPLGVGVDYFFPNQKEVLADWYFGELMICYERKYYESSGDSIYLTFVIDKGHIIEEKYQTQKEWYMSR